MKNHNKMIPRCLHLIILMVAFSLLNSQHSLLQAQDLTKVRVRTSWAPQAQFAGLYVAQEKGFFREAGLDVQIIHPKDNLPFLNQHNIETTDFLVSQLLNVLVYNDTARSDTLQLLLQTSQHTSLVIVSHRPIPRPADLEGLTIGCWRQGYSEAARCYVTEKQIPNVRWVPIQNYSRAVFISGALDAILATEYNELYQLRLSGLTLPDNQLLYLRKTQYDIPDDALFVRQAYGRQHPEATRAMTQAVRRAWEWIAQEEHRDEALDIVMRYTENTSQRTNRVLQRHMLNTVLDLQLQHNQRPFTLDRRTFDKAIRILRSGGYLHHTALYEDLIY